MLFRAAPAAARACTSRPDLGWAALVAELEIETILDGYFTTAISEPGVQVLAERLQRRLAA